MSQSITNKLIANIKQANLNNNTNNFINSENVICIDSSNNRIGINTRKPQYSIEISGSTLNHGLKASYLQIDNIANVYEISCNKITIYDELSANKIDVSNLFFNEISGNNLYVNTISAENIKISNLELPDISVNDICVNNLKIFNSFDCTAFNATFNNIDVNGITIRSDQNQDNIIALKLLRADQSANINDLSFNTAKGNYLNLSDLSVNNLDVSNNAIFSSGIDVTGEASFNSINVDGSCNLKDLTINSVNFRDAIIEQTMETLENPPNNLNPIFNNLETNLLTVNNHIIANSDINNSYIKNLIIGGSDGEPGILKLNNSELLLSNNTSYTQNSIYFQNNTLYIGTSDNTRVKIKPNTNKFIILDISNNDYNKIKKKNNQWEISGNNANSMIFTKNSINYKKFDLIVKDYEYICSNISDSIIKFDHLDFSLNDSDILNINANISIQLINKYPGDIETKNYSFGIYSYTTNETDLSINKFEDELVSIKNTIMVFDTSYNYANSNLSYIYRTKTGKEPLTGISFLIKQEQHEDLCLNNIIVSGFNATITQS